MITDDDIRTHVAIVRRCRDGSNEGTPTAILADDVERLMAERDAAHKALRAVLLFHGGGYWTPEDTKKWRSIVGPGPTISTKGLCDHIRAVLGDDPAGD